LRALRSEDIPCVLDEHVLEAASGCDERDAALACGRDRGEGAVHAPIGARGREPDPGEALLELVGRGYGVRRDPLALGTCVAEARVEHRVSLVRGVPVADDADEHPPTLPLGTADTIGPWPPP